MPETVCNKIKRFSSSPMPRPAAMCQILATGSAHQKEAAALFEHAEEFNFAAHVSLSEFENINDERVEVRSPCERSLSAPFFRIDRGRTAKAATALIYENKGSPNVYLLKLSSSDVLRETINRVMNAGSRMAKPGIAHQATENTENSIQDDKRSSVDVFSPNSRVETDH